MPRAIQLVQTLSPGDAISIHALGLEECLRRHGYASRIYAERLHPRALKLGDLVQELERQPAFDREDLAIYHYSLDSDLTPLFEAFPGQRILDYHNVTPEKFLIGFHAELVELLARGREALGRLRGVPHFSLADSEWNRQELESLGFQPTAVLPILTDLRRLSVEPDPLLLRQLQTVAGRGTTLLFVGRVIPNKGHAALLRAFSAFQRIFDPAARLLIAGEFRSIEPYNHELLRMAHALNLSQVHFLGHVTDAQLAACYRASDLFVCMSEHEGFCVPLLEAFAFGLPVLALARTAIPGTCGDAAVLLEQDDPLLAAALMDRLMQDAALRASVIEGQRKRLLDFDGQKTRELFESFLQTWKALPS